MTPQAFIAELAPIAVQLRCEGSPMFPSTRLAQNLLETGCTIHPWNNLGGIKVGSGKPNQWWDGSSVNKGTWEVINGRRVDTAANFRAYKSVYAFYKDQDLLLSGSRYARVRAAATPEEQANMLQACGYATDPAYDSKIIARIIQYGLKRFDQEAVEVLERIEQLQKQLEIQNKKIDALQERIAAPAWFVNEFGSGDLNGQILEPTFTLEGWRVLAVAMRMDK